MRGISWLAANQLASQEGPCTVEWVSKGGRCVRLTTYHHPVSLSRNLGTLTSWNPLGPSGPVTGLLCIFTFLHDDRHICFITSRSILLRMRNVSNKSCTENQTTCFVFNNFFFRKSCRLWDNVEEYCKVGQATDNNMAHAHCMLDT